VVIAFPFASLGWYFVPVGIAYSTILGFLSVGLALSGRFLTVTSFLFFSVLLSATGIWAVLWFENLGAAILVIKTTYILLVSCLGLAFFCSVLGWVRYAKKRRE
jgi:hypothetical protein